MVLIHKLYIKNKMTGLIFYFGTMNSSKTANMLMKAHNYRSKGRKILLIKPNCDTRNNEQLQIYSRAIQPIKADLLLGPEITDITSFLPDIEYILIDEAQFLSTDNINMLRNISINIPVLCYGLRTDYMSKLFPGSKRLMEVADTIEEICTICVKCRDKALINAKYISDKNNNLIIKSGSSKIDLGAEDKYQPMCWKCWNES
jgi:thymidine kinase